MSAVRLKEGFGKDLGLIHEVIVTGRRVGAGRDFWSRLAHDEGLFWGIVYSVLGRTGTTEAERLAVEILGSGNVLGCCDVCRVQKVEPPEIEPTMPFPEDVLRECAEANAQGIANWRLAYMVGHSLRQECKIMGWNPKEQPCFDPNWTWWTERAQGFWANQPVEPGYQLLDFTKRLSSLPWQDQTDEITNLGENYKRAKEQAVTEVCFSNFLLTPNKERLMPDYYHWGRLRDALGKCVCVGDFGRSGFDVSSHWGDNPHDDLSVVLSRKSPRSRANLAAGQA